MTEQRFNIRVAVGDRMLVDAHGVSVAEGGMTFLFGESGIGKSLVGKTLFGLLDESEYSAAVNGERYAAYSNRPEVVAARTRGFFVFQEPSSHLNPLQTLDDQLREGMLAEARDPIAPVRELWAEGDRDQIVQILPVYPKPYRPSGGEKQRILGAMAFAKMDAGVEGAEMVADCLCLMSRRAVWTGRPVTGSWIACLHGSSGEKRPYWSSRTTMG